MTCWKILASVGLLGFASGAYSPAQAITPEDACKTDLSPQSRNSETISVLPHSIQPQITWQRQGHDVDISITSTQPLANANVFVCFRWQVKSGSDEEIAKYKKYTPSLSITSSLPADKSAGPLTIKTTIPTTLPEAPESPRASHPLRIVGIYGQDNSFPMADIRVLVLDNNAKPILDLTKSLGIIGGDVYCDMPPMGTTATSGIGKLGEHKNWQPIGGQFEFTVKSAKQVPPNALIKVCYRWKLKKGDPRKYYDSGATHLLDRQPDSIKVAATVDYIPDQPAWRASSTKNPNIEPRIGDFAIPLIDLVPLVDARILVLDTDDSPIADVTTTVGITSIGFAWIIVIATIAGAFILLWRISRKRLPHAPKCSPLLSVITTRRGFASLSQFQIILWTFVVIASAAYVMALSGDLIEITTGTLALLGISGSATVIAKAKSENDAAAAPPAVDPASAEAEAVAAEEEAKRLKLGAALALGDSKKEADSAAEEADAISKALRSKATAADLTAKALKLRAAAVAETDAAKKPDAEKNAKDAEDAAAQAQKDAAVAAETATIATSKRHPRWSDLVMEEVKGRELDVTRIQMLYFTLVTAAFVLMKVITSYEIPIIPDGFLILMGISNSVYVGSKFATNPNAK